MSGKTPIRRRRIGLAFGLTALMLATTACSTFIRPVARNHGYREDKVKVEAIQIGKDTKASLSRKLGSPSSVGTFDPNVWYYISHTDKNFAFFETNTVRRDILEIKFDSAGKVAAINRYDVKDGHRIAYMDKETPTRGRELGFWEQMFGNVGRGLPGAAGKNTPGKR